MKILDCESIDSTYNSLSQILGVERKTLEVFFANLDIEHYCDKYGLPGPANEFILSLTAKSLDLDISKSLFDRTCWFHLTRTFPGNKFEQGILPLGEMINSIWDFLFTLIKDKITNKEWLDFRFQVENNYPNHLAYLYRLKAKDSFHWGPYAVLVRDIAFVASKIGGYFPVSIPKQKLFPSQSGKWA